MSTVLLPAGNLVRAHGRGSLLSALEKNLLITRLRVFPGGRVLFETTDWNSYWKPLLDLSSPAVEELLKALHIAWRDHIVFRFDPSLRRDFGFRYFSLLDHLLSHYSPDSHEADFHLWSSALKRALGFECFEITSASSNSRVLAAGTCTLRNPCYLLAKLKAPNALDDPQFLPLITIASLQRPELFYHYRQYSLAQDSSLSLLFYPAVSETSRTASFKLISSLASGVSDYIDPRTRQRANSLFKGIVQPIILARNGIRADPFTLEFVDVGAGSGSLVASLCRRVQALGRAMGFRPRIRTWFIDLEPSDPARFFRGKEVRGLVDSLMFLGEDYRDWLSKPQPLPISRDLRIALVSKLFNNLSRFSIRRVAPQELASVLGGAAAPVELEEHFPDRALAPGGRGAEALLVSNSRVPLRDGKTFALVSLSPYHRGLSLLLSPRDPVPPDGSIFFPVRTFNPDCLVTSDGRSVLACLLEHCDYIVIEDVDLSPKHLMQHANRFSLDMISIQDATKALGLRGNYAYVAWSKRQGEHPYLPGERIW